VCNAIAFQTRAVLSGDTSCFAQNSAQHLRHPPQTIVATIGRNQPEVVQHGAAKRGFFVNHDAAEASDSETANM